MRINPPKSPNPSAKGVSLIEAVIAVGVLAVAVPLVFGALVQSGESSTAAEAETRCSWVIPACLNELNAAALGQSRFLEEIPPGKEFNDLALGFSESGQVLQKLDPLVYSQGSMDRNVRYIVSMIAATQEQEAAGSGKIPMRRLRMRLEYPAAAPAGRRQTLDFYTHLP